MMKIAVVAANGRTGREFVAAALKAGHEVRAGIHRKSSFSDQPNLTVVQCDATKPAELKELLKGTDAAVSFIGHVRGSKADVQTEAITALIAAMQSAHIKRLISLTGTGVRIKGDSIPLIDYILNISISIIDPNRVRDGIEHFKVLRMSETEYTMIRVLKLTNRPASAFSLTPHGPTKWFVSRKDVAAAALECLEKDLFLKGTPIVSPKWFNQK